MTGPSFRFRLERVRTLREHTEDIAKQELAAAVTHRSEVEHVLHEADERLGDAHCAQRHTGSGALTAIDLVARQAYLERMELLRAAAARDLTRQDQNVARRRASVDRAMRDRKVLDRLKERRHADHAAQAAKQESAALDEVALNLFRRARA